jgi:urease accessory protein
MTSPWLLLQLADGTFPNGAFAHSAGLEARAVLGSAQGITTGAGMTPRDVGLFLDQSLRQIGRAALPFVRRATECPQHLAAIDEAYDATVLLAGPNQASRAQGRALVGAVSRVWDAAADIGVYARSEPTHHAPVFGAIFGTLGVGVEDTLAAYLHGAARGILSAGVRLGLLGPLEAQRLHAERAAMLGRILEDARSLELEDAAQTAPLLEVFAGLHERLDGRMFQS